MAKTIAFIDTRVANYLELTRAFGASVEVVFLDENQDGVQQIADALAGRRGLDALHIISHGGPASVQLGTSTLSTSTLPIYEHLLSNISYALSAGADILIYGCDVASGPEGRAFVEQLSKATGADV